MERLQGGCNPRHNLNLLRVEKRANVGVTGKAVKFFESKIAWKRGGQSLAVKREKTREVWSETKNEESEREVHVMK